MKFHHTMKINIYKIEYIILFFILTVYNVTPIVTMNIFKKIFGYFTLRQIRERRLIYELSSVKDAPKWTFQGITTYARVVSVYDGDTFHIIIKSSEMGLNSSKYGPYLDFRVRAYGYNCAEIRTADPAEKERGNADKQYAELKIGGAIIFVKFENLDKYGRPLTRIWRLENNRPIDFCSEIIRDGHARPYMGVGPKEY